MALALRAAALRQAAAPVCAPRCGALACSAQLAPPCSASRTPRFKPAAGGRRTRFRVAASDRQVEDWEPLEAPRSPPARLPQQQLPPLPPPPPRARSVMSDTMKAAAAAAAVLLLFAAREFTSDSTRFWSQVQPVLDSDSPTGVDVALIRKDGDMMIVGSQNHGELAFEQDSRGNILSTDQDGLLYITPAKLAKSTGVARILVGRVDDLTPEKLRSTLRALSALGSGSPEVDRFVQALAKAQAQSARN